MIRNFNNDSETFGTDSERTTKDLLLIISTFLSEGSGLASLVSTLEKR